MDFFHCEHAEKAMNNIPNEITIVDISDFFKILGDYTRVRLLFAIKDSELCVHDLSKILNMQQSAVSHQLKILRHYKLVKVRKDGKKSHYSLVDDHIFEILDVTLKHYNNMSN